MQLKKKFSLTAQELSHAQWIIETGNFDTELGKAIQQKLLGHVVGSHDDEVTLKPIVASDLMNNHTIHFSLGIDGCDSESGDQIADADHERILTCEFIIQAEELRELEKRFEDVDVNDFVREQLIDEWVSDRKTAEIMEKHGDTMWRMCQYEGVDEFNETSTDVIERDDGSLHFTYSVKPMYKIH